MTKKKKSMVKQHRERGNYKKNDILQKTEFVSRGSKQKMRKNSDMQN